MGKVFKRSRDDGGSMFATIIVIVGGAGLCSFLCLVDTSAFSDWMLGLVIASAALLIGGILCYRYGRNSSTNLGFWHSLHSNPADDGLAAHYRPRKVRDKRAEIQAGSNKPITADEAHEIQVTSSSTWVPSRATGEHSGDAPGPS